MGCVYVVGETVCVLRGGQLRVSHLVVVSYELGKSERGTCGLRTYVINSVFAAASIVLYASAQIARPWVLIGTSEEALYEWHSGQAPISCYPVIKLSLDLVGRAPMRGNSK